MFDRFATLASVFASPAWFSRCVLLVLVWSPSVVLFRNIDIADALADLMQEMADDRP
jgi:hypothetical protein